MACPGLSSPAHLHRGAIFMPLKPCLLGLGSMHLTPVTRQVMLRLNCTAYMGALCAQGTAVDGTAFMGRASLTSPYLRYPLTNCSAGIRFADNTLSVSPATLVELGDTFDVATCCMI